MGPLKVVGRHGLIDHFPGLCKINGALQQQLTLENPIDPFGQGILIAVISIGHGARQPVRAMNPLVGIRAILNASVRMVDQSLAALTMLECYLQGPADLLSAQAVMDVIAHDLAGIRISHQAQVNESVVGGQVGDVGHPDLLRCAGLKLLTAGLEQIGVTAKPVVAVCGLVVRPLRTYKHVRLAQNAK